MKTKITLALMLIMFAVFTNAQTLTKVFFDDFESYTVGDAATAHGYVNTSSSTGSSQVIANAVAGNSGTKYVNMTGTSQQSQNCYLTKQVSVTSGQTYIYSVYVLGVGTKGYSVIYSGTSLGTHNSGNLTGNTWQKRSYTFTATATETVGLTVYMWSTGNVYVDDFSFYREQWNITASSNNASYGSVSGTTGLTDPGTSVSLTATPNSGYAFVNWTENGTQVSVNPTYTFTASADRTLVANFTAQSGTITGAATASAFTTTYGTASTAQTFTVGGTNLSANLVATAPSGFEVSSDGSSYGSTATFTQSGGTASGTLYIRLAANAAVLGTYNSQNIVLSSTGANPVNITTAASGNAVSPKALSVTGYSIAAKTYNGNKTSGTITVGTITGFVGTETVTATASCTLSSPNVWGEQGTIVYTLVNGANGGLASNYSLANASYWAAINQAQLNITAGNQTVTYGTAASAVTAAENYTPSGFVGSDNSGIMTGTATYTTTYTNTTAAGTSGVTITYNSGLNTTYGNYWFNKIAGTITITKATPSISVSGTQSFTYNGSAQGPSTVSYNGDGGTPTLLYTNTSGTAYSSATAPTNAGNYQVVASAAAGTNYNAASSSAYTFTITAATPTVTPTVGTYTYNASSQGPNAATNTGTGSNYTFSYAGVAPTVYSASSTPPTAAGTYTVTVTVAADGNYTQGVSAATAFSILSTGVVSTANTLVSSLTLSPSSDISIIGCGTLEIDVNNTSVHSITSAPGTQLTIDLNKSLSVSGDLQLQSSSSGTATLVDKTTTGALTVTGNTTVQQFLTTDRNWYISSPVSGAYSSVFNAAAASNINKLYSYNETQGSFAPLNWPQISDNVTSLAIAQGYVANVDASLLTVTNGVTFSGGTLNTGDITTGTGSYALTYTSNQAYAGYNLVGNPYPSYLNWNGVTKTNLVSNTMWYRTNVGGSYYFYTYNSVDCAAGIGISVPADVTNYIPPMQAFWVRAASTGASLTFHNTDRAHQDVTNNKLRARAQTSSSLQLARLQVSNGVNSDETVLYTYPNASNQYDSYDSPKMTNANAAIPEIYTTVANENLVINGMTAIPFNSEIPLGFTTGQAGTNFSIKASQVSNFPAGTQVILKDYLNTNNPVITDLSDGSSYTFSSGITANNTSRFALLFHAPSIATGINPNNSNDVWISTNKYGQIIVNGANTETTVAVYNAVGQKLSSQTLKSSTSVLDNSFVPGVYMVCVTNSGKTLTKKIILD